MKNETNSRGAKMGIVTNPLAKFSMFATPEENAEIVKMIEGLPKKYRGIGYTISAMTWNKAVADVDTALYMKKKGEELAGLVAKHYKG